MLTMIHLISTEYCVASSSKVDVYFLLNDVCQSCVENCFGLLIIFRVLLIKPDPISIRINLHCIISNKFCGVSFYGWDSNGI